MDEQQVNYLRKKLGEDYKEWRKETFEEPFIMVPESLIRTQYLNDSEKDMYMRLMCFANFDTGETFVSDRRLQLESGKSLRQVQRIIAQLEEKKMIQRLTVDSDYLVGHRIKRFICLLPFPDELYEQVYSPEGMI